MDGPELADPRNLERSGTHNKEETSLYCLVRNNIWAGQWAGPSNRRTGLQTMSDRPVYSPCFMGLTDVSWAWSGQAEKSQTVMGRGPVSGLDRPGLTAAHHMIIGRARQSRGPLNETKLPGQAAAHRLKMWSAGLARAAHQPTSTGPYFGAPILLPEFSVAVSHRSITQIKQ